MSAPDPSQNNDKPPSSRTRFILMAAVPLGAFIGLVIGGYICLAVLHSEGRSQSHNDAIAVAGAGACGLLVGAVSLPIITWCLFGKRLK